MNWLVWTWVILGSALPVLLCLRSMIKKWWLGQQIRKLKQEVESLRSELVRLEALTPEDRTWLDRQWQNPAHD